MKSAATAGNKWFVLGPSNFVEHMENAPHIARPLYVDLAMAKLGLGIWNTKLIHR